MGLQGLTSQSTMKEELEAAGLTTKETVFFYYMVVELGFNVSFRSLSCISTTRHRWTPPATVPAVLAQSTSR